MRDLGDMTLTSVTGYVDFDRTFDIDADATPARELDFLETDDVRQFSQELRLAGDSALPNGSSARSIPRDEVVTSIPGQHDDLLFTRTLVSVDQDTDSAAAFANGDWQLADTSESHYGFALHVGGAALRRRHDRSQSVRRQLPAEPDVHARIRRARRR